MCVFFYYDVYEQMPYKNFSSCFVLIGSFLLLKKGEKESSKDLKEL